MDKYHYVLNALLDELDFLRREQQEALQADSDYDYTAWLQIARIATSSHLNCVYPIFQESQPGHYHLPESISTGVFDKYLTSLLRKSVTELRLVFKQKQPRNKERHIEFIKFSLDKSTLNCTLVHFIDVNHFRGSDSGYEWWQKKRLKQIGWQIDNPDIEQYSIQFSLRKKGIKQRVMECIARTIFEAFYLHKKTTKLVVRNKA